MFDFIIKKKKIELRCYPLEPILIDLFPIRLSKDIHPNFFKKLKPYKKLENTQTRMPTVKVCPGLKYYLDYGVTIPLWHDYKIIRDQNNKITRVDVPTKHGQRFELHENAQFEGAFPGFSHIKLISPWFIDTDRPLDFVAVSPTWHLKNPTEYILAPGSLEFKYQHSCHAQVFLPPLGYANELTLEAGVPIMQLIPTEKVDIDIKLCEMNNQIHSKLVNKYFWTWDNIYRKTRTIIERNND